MKVREKVCPFTHLSLFNIYTSLPSMVNTSPLLLVRLIRQSRCLWFCSGNMASISQGLMFTTAMVLSTTALYLAFSRPKTSTPFQIPPNSNSSHSSNKQIVRSCIYSEEKKKERRKNKKKVKFAENVMVKEVERDNKEEKRVTSSECNREMPANRIALYNGILRDRVQRMACCH
ncbi:hypothetical protein CR513_48127, partial [Mucuna pruriens]